MKCTCKSLRIKERQQTQDKRKKRKQSSPLWYKVNPNDPSVLILRNGMRIKQKEGLDLFISDQGALYSLTRRGLRRLRINYTRKRRYGKKSRNGVPNGRRYPYITFRGGTYVIHILMVETWIRPRREGEEIDHINGNIDDCRLINLRIVTKEENRRCAQILRRLRKAAKQLNDPSLDPLNIPQPRLLKIFATLTVGDPAKIMEDDFKYHREF